MTGPIAASRSDRWFFVAVAVGVAIVVIAGFTPSYAVRLARHDRNLNGLVHAHGLLSASWIALFLIQSWLVAAGRTDIHRRLGVAGAVLAATVFCVGAATLLQAAQRRGPELHAANGGRLVYLLIAFAGAGLLVFAGLVATAIALRRSIQWHNRLMALAALSILGPAFGRITAYANNMRGDNDLAVLLLCAGCVIVCASTDAIRHRQLHPAFFWGGACVLAMYLSTYVAKTLL